MNYVPFSDGQDIPDSRGDRAALRDQLLAQTPEPEPSPGAPTLRAHGTPSKAMKDRVVAGAVENARRTAELDAKAAGLREDRATLDRERAALEAERREIREEKAALAALAGAQRRKHEDWEVARLIWVLALATVTVVVVLAVRAWGHGG